jgi:SAM-dependent methyltransferase
LGLVSSAARHREFFQAELGALAGDGGYRRVLVSGAADYAMLEVVAGAYGGAALLPTVVDICQTPIETCRWYAERQGISLATKAGDILDFDADEPFDIVCSHSFLQFFTPAARTKLMARWHRLLRPGGKVVTVTRIASGDAFDKAKSAAFRDRVLSEAERNRALLDIAPETLADHAARYAAGAARHHLGSRREVARLFEAGGFSLDRLELQHMDGAVGAGESGPGLNQDAAYALIIATRI